LSSAREISVTTGLPRPVCHLQECMQAYVPQGWYVQEWWQKNAAKNEHRKQTQQLKEKSDKRAIGKHHAILFMLGEDKTNTDTGNTARI